MKLDILAFGAHPDDIELGAGGTLLDAVKRGYQVGLIDLTLGELGSNGSIEIRKIESDYAMNFMGAKIRDNLMLEDGYFSVNTSSINLVAAKIRKYKPEIVLANALTDRHPDHGQGATLVKKACFISGLVKVNLYENGLQLDSWRPKIVMHYVQDRYLKPDLVIDISDQMERKLELVACFKSQFNYSSNEDFIETPINKPDFYDFLLARSKEYGRIIDVKYGEGFVIENPIRFKSLKHFLD